MPRLSSSGRAVMGVGVTPTSIDGAVPTPLIGSVGGGWAWLNVTTIIGAANFGSGYNLYSATASVLSTIASGLVNQVAAGADNYGTWTSGVGVQTNITGLTLLPSAGLGDIDADGRIVVVNNRLSGTGLTVYGTDGALLIALPDVVLSNNSVRLRGGVLAYQGSDGWHLWDALLKREITWLRRAVAIALTVPVVVDNALWVLEQESATGRLTLRLVTSVMAFLLDDTGSAFGADVVSPSTGVARMAWSTVAEEAAADLILMDVIVATGQTSIGTVDSGAIVWASADDRADVKVPVTSAASVYVPYRMPFLDTQRNVITKPWLDFFITVSKGLQNAQTDINSIQPVTVPPPGFGRVEVVSDGVIAAAVPNDLMLLIMGAGMAAVVDPVAKSIELEAVGPTLDASTLLGRGDSGPGVPEEITLGSGLTMTGTTLSATGGGSGTAYVPVSTGAEPLVILSNGAGAVLLTPYTP